MAKDIFHAIVKEALIKEGWIVTHDNNYRLKTDLIKEPLTIDLAAEKLLIAERGVDKIAVEVKSFLGDSLIYDFHGALGQLMMYQVNLEIQEPNRVLYLSIPSHVYEKMQKLPVFEVIFERYQINIVIFEPDKKEIIEWKKYQK
jgi:hypothetical protein